MSVFFMVALVISVVLMVLSRKAQSNIVRAWLLVLPGMIIIMILAEALFNALCEGTAFGGWSNCRVVPDGLAAALDAPLFLLPQTTVISAPVFLIFLAYIEWKHRRKGADA
ncbi:hypothetical protein [Pseudaestuariivita rosea]|uniref:hypothetical protein n=1 Tax=Pseudaestuariivita rosea TaxID=2763263 RepID=UPI001ABA0890|nr:hypothetical protein [Pseudaestuariivita rosea]